MATSDTEVMEVDISVTDEDWFVRSSIKYFYFVGKYDLATGRVEGDKQGEYGGDCENVDIWLASKFVSSSI